MEKKNNDSVGGAGETEGPSRYSYSEDMAIVEYMTTADRYLKSSGIRVWKDAEKYKICAGRTYLSMKERFRKVIVKDLKQYNVEKSLALRILQFMRANKYGKQSLRHKQSKLCGNIYARC